MRPDPTKMDPSLRMRILPHSLNQVLTMNRSLIGYLPPVRSLPRNLGARLAIEQSEHSTRLKNNGVKLVSPLDPMMEISGVDETVGNPTGLALTEGS